MGKSSSQCGVLEPVSAKVMGGRLGYKGGELERGVCVCVHACAPAHTCTWAHFRAFRLETALFPNLGRDKK